MSWPRKNREAVVALIQDGLKTVKAIASELGCSEGYVYRIMTEDGYSRQFISREEWKYIKAWRANRQRIRTTSPEGVAALVGSDNHTPEKARRAS